MGAAESFWKPLVGPLLRPLSDRGLFLGPVRFLHCLVDETGACAVKEFLMRLAEGDKGAYTHRFSVHSAHGEQKLRGDSWKPLRRVDALFEYKHIGSKSRIIHTTDNDNLVVLLMPIEGKKEDDLPETLIKQAERLRDNYRSRRDALLGARQRKRR